MVRIFDEIGGERISIDYEEYFGEMDISDKEKKERIELSRKLEVLFLFLFMAYSKEQSEEIQNILEEKYRDIAMDFIGTNKKSSYIAEYAKQIIEETIKITNNNIKEPYYTSWDRAMALAENESNAIANYRMQLEAVKQGKKEKTWITKNDRKVRHTHKEVNGVTIPIFEPFRVGESKMMFPKDSSLGAKTDQIAGCRCVVKYS